MGIRILNSRTINVGIIGTIITASVSLSLLLLNISEMPLTSAYICLLLSTVSVVISLIIYCGINRLLLSLCSLKNFSYPYLPVNILLISFLANICCAYLWNYKLQEDPRIFALLSPIPLITAAALYYALTVKEKCNKAKVLSFLFVAASLLARLLSAMYYA